MKEKIKGFYWHVHHDKLLEWCYDRDERIEYIRKDKPKHEIKLRLKMFKPVRGKLPAEVVKARESHDKAKEAYYKAEKAYDKAWEAYGKSIEKHKKAIERLHEKECTNCPWDGRTIFPKKKVK